MTYPVSLVPLSALLSPPVTMCVCDLEEAIEPSRNLTPANLQAVGNLHRALRVLLRVESNRAQAFRSPCTVDDDVGVSGHEVVRPENVLKILPTSGEWKIGDKDSSTRAGCCRIWVYRTRACRRSAADAGSCFERSKVRNKTNIEISQRKTYRDQKAEPRLRGDHSAPRGPCPALPRH